MDKSRAEEFLANQRKIFKAKIGLFRTDNSNDDSPYLESELVDAAMEAYDIFIDVFKRNNDGHDLDKISDDAKCSEIAAAAIQGFMNIRYFLGKEESRKLIGVIIRDAIDNFKGAYNVVMIVDPRKFDVGRKVVDKY